MKAFELGNIKSTKFDKSKIKSKSNIVLFPAGKATKTFLNFNSDLDISYICDNNKNLAGESIGGIEIILPTKLVEMNGDYTIIITSPNLLAAFLFQLESLAILQQCEIILYNPHVVKKFYDDFKFTDRRAKSNKMLLILAGYKPKLWEIVFKRIKTFIPNNIDVCVVTAGKEVSELDIMCETNGWSYLSTATNNCCLAQNIAFALFDTAEWIYKLDEDMFICDGYFEGLYDTYIEAEKSRYHVGMVAPLIPVNPHGNILFLEKLGLLEDYENKFGKAYYDFSTHFKYKTDETLFFWQHSLPIDLTAKKIRKNNNAYAIAPHRFSIGAILFKKDIWEEIGGFTVWQDNGVGKDEEDFAVYFLSKTNFYTYIISENTFAAHYSFGQIQNPKLLNNFYLEHYSQFDIQTNYQKSSLK